MKKPIFIVFLLSISFLTVLGAKEFYNNSLLNKIEKKYGKYAKNRFLLLKKQINSSKSQDDIEKLTLINSFFNKVNYSSDLNIWGKKDYWATPFEFLGKDAGDSEDFVFAKFFTLVEELDLDKNKFFFTYVKEKKRKISYMVLAYYKTKKSIPLILDTINYKVLPASKRSDIVPIYSFSAKSAGYDVKEGGFKAKQGLKFKNLLTNIKREKI